MKILIHIAPILQNFKILENPFEVEIPHWNPFEVEVPRWNLFEVEVPHCGLPNFRPDLVLPDTYNGLKFEFCSFSSIKVDKLVGKTEIKRKNSIQVNWGK